MEHRPEGLGIPRKKKTVFSSQPSGSAAPPPLREEGVGFSVGGPDSTLPGCWLLKPPPPPWVFKTLQNLEEGIGGSHT